jgi:hypothetical protein
MNLNWTLLSILAISLIFNGILIWYTVKILQKLSYIYDNAESLQIVNKSFLEHIQAVHEMEMFFGDETLGGLMQHSHHVAEQYNIFNEIFEDLQYGIIQLAEEETQEETDAEEEIG